jgi:hypothetical protein
MSDASPDGWSVLRHAIAGTGPPAIGIRVHSTARRGVPWRDPLGPSRGSGGATRGDGSCCRLGRRGGRGRDHLCRRGMHLAQLTSDPVPGATRKTLRSAADVLPGEAFTLTGSDSPYARWSALPVALGVARSDSAGTVVPARPVRQWSNRSGAQFVAAGLPTIIASRIRAGKVSAV